MTHYGHQICPRPSTDPIVLSPDTSPSRSFLDFSSMTNFTAGSTARQIALPARVPESPVMLSFDDLNDGYNFAPDDGMMELYDFNFIDNEDAKPVNPSRRESGGEEIVDEIAVTILQEEKFQHISDLINEAQSFNNPIMAAYPVEQSELTTMLQKPENTHLLDLDSYRYEPEMTTDYYTSNPNLATGQFNGSDILNEEPPSTSAAPQVKIEADTRFPAVLEEFNSPPTKTRKTKRSKTRSVSKTLSKTKGKAPAKPKNANVKVEVKDGETYNQAVRRVKNNEASRVHRSKKKNNLQYLLLREEELLTANDLITGRLASLDEIAKMLKEGLVQHGRNRRLPD